MARFHVNGKVVDTVDLLRKRHWPWRFDSWPFGALYVIWMIVIVPTFDFLDAFIILGGLFVVHVLMVLFTVWSVDFKCFVQFSKVKDINHANACKITPAKFCGSKEVVPLHFRKLAGSSTEEMYFDFRKQCFIYSNEKKTFCKLPYPSKESFGYYLKSTGHGTEAKVQVAAEKWGRNVFEYPQPTFQKLMKEHCMEPFFVFQVFCVGLWCLDEYWYYSLFTLFMLFMFESTMAKSRLKTLSELRRVRVDSQMLMAYRCGKWTKVAGTELLPGDVVSVGRVAGQDGEEKAVPADMLILAGNAIVNEAILTGESTPQWKVSIMGRGPEERLSSKRDKNHVLFGGTKILQHTPDKTFQMKTPDGGCLAIVLRTGFETTQGKLMWTILFSTERVGDPLEKASIKGIEWSYKSDEKALPKKLVILLRSPHRNVFCLYDFLSLLVQFALHILFLISSVKEAERHMPDECIEPDSEFESNLVNTVSYMVSMMIQVATFAVNYMGRPFNQSISENKPFKFALLGSVVFFTVITSDLFRDLND